MRWLGPFLLAVLVSGLLLSLSGVACTSARVRCKTACLDTEDEAATLLDDCLQQCHHETKSFTGGLDCKVQCSDGPPNLDYEVIKVGYDDCKYYCRPRAWVVKLLFQGGGAAVLSVLGVVLTACCSRGGVFGIFGLRLAQVQSSSHDAQAPPSHRNLVGVRCYAWLFYILALVLFYFVSFKKMQDETGVKLVCLLTAVLSLSCQGLDEVRVLLLQFEVPYSELAETTKRQEAAEESAASMGVPQGLGKAWETKYEDDEMGQG